MPSFSTTLNPGIVVDIPDVTYVDDDGNTRTLRPPSGTELPVKNASTLDDLDPIVLDAYGQWEYTTDDGVTRILVSPDGGTTWVGPLYSGEAVEASMSAGVNASDALVAAQNAVLIAQAAAATSGASGSGVEVIVEVAGSLGVYPSPLGTAMRWFYGEIEPTASQGFRETDIWWSVVVS
jgi:hypothetical protein